MPVIQRLTVSGDFIHEHPEYKQDSVVSEPINFDLMDACNRVSLGEVVPSDLLIPNSSKTKDDLPSALRKAETHEKSRKANMNGKKQ